MSSSGKEMKTDFTILQSMLRKQLKPYGFCGQNLVDSFEIHKRHLLEMVKRTISMGESNSLLIIGPRGSGKSTLLEYVISELHSDVTLRDNVICVSLNGLIHTDDRVALKDIIHQLQLDNVIDTAVGSFAEKLSFLLEALKDNSKQSKSVLFILDEFDLFCTHKDQTLLYNFFDIAQSQQSPICVIGMTCRPDILQNLENRVKSRFSHQHIYLFESVTFNEYLDITKAVLTLPSDFRDKKFRNFWNLNVAEVIDQPVVKDVLKKQYEFSRGIRDLKRFLFYLVMSVNLSHPVLEAGDFIDAFSYFTKDSKANILQGLSLLEISLVIAMMHLTETFDGEPFNFETVYHEYKNFLQKKMNFQNLDKAVVMKALEHLMAIELVKSVADSSANRQKRYTPVRLLVEPSQIRDTLKQYSNLPVQLQQWASSAICE